MTTPDSLATARAFRDLLMKQGIPVRAVYLFGSAARGAATEESDIDIAVVCAPFREDRVEENLDLWRARRSIDVRIEPVCLHPEDMENRLFGLAQEIRRTGIEV